MDTHSADTKRFRDSTGTMPSSPHGMDLIDWHGRLAPLVRPSSLSRLDPRLLSLQEKLPFQGCHHPKNRNENRPRRIPGREARL